MLVSYSSSSCSTCVMTAILNLLLHYHAHNPGSEKAKEGLECALHTLRMMGRGGMHDHVGKVGVSIATKLGVGVSIATKLGVGVSIKGIKKWVCL